ncbi:MAG: hypothetical protein HY459_00190 [Parcubacteria group bacterium]|nr:hypothetical protein [Parcubacteria group bacterium]
MDLAFWGITLQTIGGIMIAYTALMVHRRVWKDHKVDEAVFKTMGGEQRIGILGILFLVTGYILHLLAR